MCKTPDLGSNLGDIGVLCDGFLEHNPFGQINGPSNADRLQWTCQNVNHINLWIILRYSISMFCQMVLDGSNTFSYYLGTCQVKSTWNGCYIDIINNTILNFKTFDRNVNNVFLLTGDYL